jgi:hypothetical protein
MATPAEVFQFQSFIGQIITPIRYLIQSQEVKKSRQGKNQGLNGI